MNYADIKYPDIANGEDIRVSLFVSGCTHHCCGCFNPETWNFGYGKTFDEEAKAKIFNALSLSHVKGLSILGGEPFDNAKELADFVFLVKQRFPEKTIWIYSGYTFEEILPDYVKFRLLYYADVLVDGEFVLEKKNVNLRFRGSENQRIIYVKESIDNCKAIIYNLGD